MVKLDLILLPFVLLLWVSLLVMSLSFTILKHIKLLFCAVLKSTQYPYDYFFHPFNNRRLRAELTNTIIWLWYVALSILLSLIYWTYRVTRFGCQWSQLLWMAVTFWPKLYLYLLGPSSNGCSILEIFVDPTNVGKPRRFNIYQSNRAMRRLLRSSSLMSHCSFRSLTNILHFIYLSHLTATVHAWWHCY